MIPNTGGDHSPGLGDSPHLGKTSDRIGHEMDNQLRQSPVEDAIVEGKALGRRLMNFDARLPLANGLHERHGRIYRRHGLGAKPLDKFAGERPRPAPHIQDTLAGADAGQIGQLARKVSRVPTHEAVIRIRSHRKAHKVKVAESSNLAGS